MFSTASHADGSEVQPLTRALGVRHLGAANATRGKRRESVPRWEMNVTNVSDLGLSYRMVAPSRADTPRIAREWVALILRGAGCEHLVEAARLCTSEVVTNAHRHTPTAVIAVEVAITGGRVTVEVCDRGPVGRLAREGPGGGLFDTGGRGLALLRAYADDWAVVAGEGEKVVWFRLVG
ncbi:ATP-binding protein [Streptomyces sp. NPDC090021]|uniref:ATP-binding protein n=1 Tax=Streptomyces sp. NPDC090021 TaxID=3365919 RepID=UPI0038049742